MPAFAASAPGKAILLGEHSVVYGQPALAVPVTQVQARVVIVPDPALKPGQIMISAPDIALENTLDQLEKEHPFRQLFTVLGNYFKIDHFPSARVKITSTIPIAAGLGSGAAVSVALIRVISAFLGQKLENSQVSALAYEIEKIHHGSPSGIDNTVITFSQPIYYVRGQPFEPLKLAANLTLIIADTGVRSQTSAVVNDVRARWQTDPDHYEMIFANIGEIVQRARMCLERGDCQKLGNLMDENHALLQNLDVSSVELDRLVNAARAAGALGAKLCGAGRGGNMIALVPPELSNTVRSALTDARAVRTFETHL